MKIETEKRGYNHIFWTAIDSASYDGAPDSNANFIGYGDTEEEAIEDLKNILDDERCSQGRGGDATGEIR